MLSKSKLDSTETLVSQALIDMEISHEKFVTTLGEKSKYEKMKENLRNVNEQQENKRLNSVNSKKKKKNEFVNMWMVKRIEHLHHQKSVYMYKMVDISAETWNKTGVSVIKVH